MTLTLTNVTKRYGEFELNLSLDVPTGYITGLVGTNGAGKTTAMRCALGLAIPDSGTIDIVANKELGVVFDTVHLPGEMKVAQLLKHLRPFYDTWEDPDLEFWGLTPDASVKELSRGMGMKLQLAIALAHKPRLLILDEPTSGIDPATRDEMLHILQDYVASGENTVLYSTHIITDLEKCADYLAMIADGQLVDFASVDDWREGYRMVKGAPGTVPQGATLYGLRETEVSWSALMHTAEANSVDALVEPASLEDIVVRLS